MSDTTLPIEGNPEDDDDYIPENPDAEGDEEDPDPD